MAENQQHTIDSLQSEVTTLQMQLYEETNKRREVEAQLIALKKWKQDYVKFVDETATRALRILGGKRGFEKEDGNTGSAAKIPKLEPIDPTDVAKDKKDKTAGTSTATAFKKPKTEPKQ